MNFKLILIFCIIRTILIVSSIKDGFECVKRKTGACKVFNVTEDFENFIALHTFEYGQGSRIVTIIEIDYLENKYSYELGKNKKNKEFDTAANPLVEILFSEAQDTNSNTYRLVLGEKLNQMAYLEVDSGDPILEFNNYSPDLPTWPIAINVTVDFLSHNDSQTQTKFSVFTKNGDGFDKDTPFLNASSHNISVQYMTARSRNRNVGLVGFYDCSTKYGYNCGTEKTQQISDCRRKISPTGDGKFRSHVDMTKFNRLGKEKSEESIFEYNEIFGIYRRNNDDMHIIFSTEGYSDRANIRLIIGEDLIVRERTHDPIKNEYHHKTAIKKGWSQEPTEPNFIRVHLSTESKQISIYNLNTTDDEEESIDKPILTMKLCNYFDDNDVQFMSATSNRFKTVDLYYDCCLPNEKGDCHAYEEDDGDTESDHNDCVDTEDNDDKISNLFNVTGVERDIFDVKFCEKKTLKGVAKSRTFLDTSNFVDPETTDYVYKNGKSKIDYCPNGTAVVELTPNIEKSDIEDDDDDDDDDDVVEEDSMNKQSKTTFELPDFPRLPNESNDDYIQRYIQRNDG